MLPEAVEAPVRAYRIGPPAATSDHARLLLGGTRPTLAVIPFTAREGSGDQRVLGEVLAEEMIRELSRSRDRQRDLPALDHRLPRSGRHLAEINAHLNADYVVSGIYRVDGHKITLNAELAEARSGHIAWAECAQISLPDLGEEHELVGRVVTDIRVP